MPAAGWYNAVWRWHFYAGLFCLPFLLRLSLTGTLYLWKPQIGRWQERAYDTLPVTGTAASPETQAAAALVAHPGLLEAYQPPQGPGQAAGVLIERSGVVTRVYVDPYRKCAAQRAGEGRAMRTVSRLHGTLLVGNPGSWLVEIAACWTITMLLPRGRRGTAGVLYPRRRGGDVPDRDGAA